jgi:hypothetical protein
MQHFNKQIAPAGWEAPTVPASRQVTTMRQELEDFLKDDDDMAKMCLSRKRDQAAQWAAASNVQGCSPSMSPGHTLSGSLLSASLVHLYILHGV